MSSCAIATCKNYKKKTPDILFHRFPANDHYKKLWIEKCKRKDAFRPHCSRICSAHFTEEDYERDLKNELLGLPCRKVLTDTAVPSKNLPLEIKVGSSSSFCRLENRNVRKRAIERLNQLSPIKKPKMSNDQDILNNKNRKLESDTEKKIKELENENQKLKEYIMKLEKKVEITNIRLRREKTISLSKINDFKKKSEFIFQKKLKEEIKRIFKNVFTESQIKALIDGKRITKWKEEDIVNAITLRAISHKAYIYLRNRLEMPLPSISTLKRWCKKIDVSEGILWPIINFMKMKGDTMTEAEKFTVLCFDEMNIDSRICYDSSKDKILGPHSNVQVVMAKGLVKYWKQPLYYDFDQQMTKELLFEIIAKLEEIGFKVLSIVSDLGGKNIRLWNQLNITPTKSSFFNPNDASRNIWVFADFPHLIKLLRNHILDHGIKLPCGKIIEKAIFEKLLEADSGELKICPKLSWSHIQVRNNERQNVRMAAQLLSTHVSKALLHYFPGENETSDFISVIDGCFDIFNSRVPVGDKSERCAFGLRPESQMVTLSQAKHYIEEMRVVNRPNLLPFQKGWLVSIESLLGLHEFLKQNEIKYILTSRVNQDSLENLFSQIRGLGKFYDHPLPIDFKYRLRHILLCNKLPVPSTNVSTIENSNEETFLSAQLCNSLINARELIEKDALCNTSFQANCSLKNLEDEDDILFSNLNSPSSSNVDETKNIQINGECTNDALHFIAGYIAFKVHDKSLGINTSSAAAENKKSTWIEALSRGGLTLPTECWFETVKKT